MDNVFEMMSFIFGFADFFLIPVTLLFFGIILFWLFVLLPMGSRIKSGEYKVLGNADSHNYQGKLAKRELILKDCNGNIFPYNLSGFQILDSGVCLVGACIYLDTQKRTAISVHNKFVDDIVAET